MVRPLARLAPVLCAAALALGACTTPTAEGFDARMSSLIGRPEAELVAALGVPVRTHETGGQRFLQYESRRLLTYPGFAPYPYGPYSFGSYPFGGYRYGYGGFGGIPPSVESRECDLTFALRNGRVEGFTRRGNDCRALPPNIG